MHGKIKWPAKGHLGRVWENAKEIQIFQAAACSLNHNPPLFWHSGCSQNLNTLSKIFITSLFLVKFICISSQLTAIPLYDSQEQVIQFPYFSPASLWAYIWSGVWITEKRDAHL